MTTPALKSALLEIGTEELPARFVPSALEQLSAHLEKGLSEAGVEHKQIEVWGTPRRLVATISGIPNRAHDRTEIAIGPPPQAAKDSQGNWTAAALGFAKSQKCSVEQLTLQKTAKGERYVVVRELKGQKSELALKELFPSVIKSLVFPKSMIWESTGFRFARPLRWIVALYNSNILRFKVAGVSSDRTTIGLLALGGKKISIARAEIYKSLVQGRCLMVDPALREKTIRSQMEAIGKRLNARVLIDPKNLEEVVHLTEYPVAMVGHFKSDYLSLPREVLISSLIKHQKFFPVETSKGQLSSAFIGVRNGPSDSQETVRDGYERVINARLADARFFFDHDSKIKLEDLVPKLKGVGFLEKVGTLFDKMERVRRFSEEIARKLNFTSEQVEHTSRISTLAKADLLTQMVGEFPDLQGVAGRFYSSAYESGVVSKGLEEHYWPLTADGILPTSPEAAVVSIADKLDTLAAYFSLGETPTGSADPNGLRRLGTGVVRILRERGWSLKLETLVASACSTLSLSPEVASKTGSELNDFLMQRFSNWLSHQGFRLDEIEAVFAVNGESLTTLHEKCEGLKGVRHLPEFESLAAAIKRARNILKQAHEKGIRLNPLELKAEELQSDSERMLLASLASVKPEVVAALERRNYKEALLILSQLKKPVDAFFEGVMVMVDDAKVRDQRLSLLQSVKDLFDSLADFSKLQGSAAS